MLQALKTYGMILADNGSNWYISGAPSPKLVERRPALARPHHGLGLRGRRHLVAAAPRPVSRGDSCERGRPGDCHDLRRQVAESHLGGGEAAHAVDAAARRGRRGAEVDAARAAFGTGRASRRAARRAGGDPSGRRSGRRRRGCGCAPRARPGRARCGPGCGRGSPGAKRSTCASIASVMSAVRAVRDVAVRPCRVPARRRARLVPEARLREQHERTRRATVERRALRRGDLRRSEPPRWTVAACAQRSSRHGIGPESAQSSLNAPGPWRYRRSARSYRAGNDPSRSSSRGETSQSTTSARGSSSTGDDSGSRRRARAQRVGQRVRERLRAAARERPADRVTHRQQARARSRRSAAARAAASSAPHCRRRGRAHDASRTSAPPRPQPSTSAGAQRAQRACRAELPQQAQRRARVERKRREERAARQHATRAQADRRADRYGVASAPSPAAVSSTLRTSSAASSSSNGCATHAGDSSHSTPSSSSRKQVDDVPSGWIGRAHVVTEAGQRQLLRAHSAADPLGGLVHDDVEPGARERDRGSEPVRPRADDDRARRQAPRAPARRRAGTRAPRRPRCSTPRAE